MTRRTCQDGSVEVDLVPTAGRPAGSWWRPGASGGSPWPPRSGPPPRRASGAPGCAARRSAARGKARVGQTAAVYRPASTAANIPAIRLRDCRAGRGSPARAAGSGRPEGHHACRRPTGRGFCFQIQPSHYGAIDRGAASRRRALLGKASVKHAALVLMIPNFPPVIVLSWVMSVSLRKTSRHGAFSPSCRVPHCC